MRLLYAVAFVISLALIWFFLSLQVHAHMADRPDLDGWFAGLRSKNGLCCSFADGEQINDVDWDTSDGHYRVRLDGRWIDIPDDAVITSANRYGPAIVWPIRYNGSIYQIRCFLPGAGT